MPTQIRCFFVACAVLSIHDTGRSGQASFDLTELTDSPQFEVAAVDDVLTVRWHGRDGDNLAMDLGIVEGRPVIRRLTIAVEGKEPRLIGSDLFPELSIVSGVRRITQQQTEPLEAMGIEITEEVIDRHKWDAFWDAPLVTGERAIQSRKSSIPARLPFANHPGLPRKPSEVLRAETRWDCRRGTVRCDGLRLTIEFSGVEAGLFSGSIRFDLFAGSNLIRQMAVVKTEQPSVAFKYEGGMTGLNLGPTSRVVYRDLGNLWQERFPVSSPRHEKIVVTSANRVLAVDIDGVGFAVFPPPHSFYWARESERNLGYGYYRNVDAATFAIGIRQAEAELDEAFEQNFALYNARPGAWQRLPVFYELSHNGGQDAIRETLLYTRGDRFGELPGYRVMGHHYHVGMMQRLDGHDEANPSINDVASAKAAGIDIYSIVDGVRGSARHDRGKAFVEALDRYYEAARTQSDENFLLMPSDENSTGGRPPFLGGHYDLLPSHPVYWRPRRDPDEALYETHPKYGRVYHVATPEDLMRMCEAENVLVSMPHPNTKRSTGYPDAILQEPHFLHRRYFSLGFRWGMGIDASERRLGEYRFLRLWDRVNNHMARLGKQPKFALAISETRSDHDARGKPLGDDVYGMSPVNYVKLDRLPTIDDMSPLLASLASGHYFVTSGEVLIPEWQVTRSGDQLQVTADARWTFPLDFAEVVWGDGDVVDRQIVSAKHLPAFSKHRFQWTLAADDVRWLRVAAWDCANNGALTQPVTP